MKKFEKNKEEGSGIKDVNKISDSRLTKFNKIGTDNAPIEAPSKSEKYSLPENFPYKPNINERHIPPNKKGSIEKMKNKFRVEKSAGIFITKNRKKRIDNENNTENNLRSSYFFFKKFNIYAPNPHPNKADEIATNAKWYQSNAEKILVSKTSNINPVREIKKTPTKTENLSLISKCNSFLYDFI